MVNIDIVMSGEPEPFVFASEIGSIKSYSCKIKEPLEDIREYICLVCKHNSSCDRTKCNYEIREGVKEG